MTPEAWNALCAVSREFQHQNSSEQAAMTQPTRLLPFLRINDVVVVRVDKIESVEAADRVTPEIGPRFILNRNRNRNWVFYTKDMDEAQRAVRDIVEWVDHVSLGIADRDETYFCDHHIIAAARLG